MSKLKRLQDKHQLSLRVQSGLVLCSVVTTLQAIKKCCPKCHEGIWCIPALNVTEEHQPKTNR